jgi:NitT/TauT family transport system substrate-binding protein
VRLRFEKAPLHRVALGLACVALAVALPACGSDDAESANAGGGDGDLPVVKMQGFSGGLSPIVLKVIEEEGLDKANGFDGDFLYLDPGASTQTFLQRETDVAFDQDVISVAIARAAGHKVTAFYPNVVQTSSIIVRGDSEYQTPKDLVGKQVGQFGLDSGTTTAFAAMLGQIHGIDVFEDYQLAEIGFGPSLGQVLDAGEVEASFISEPLTTNDIAEHGSRVVFNGKEAWDEEAGYTPTVNNLVAYEDWIKENPELAYGVRRAYQQAYELIVDGDYKLIREEPYKGMLALKDAEAEDLFIERADEFGGGYFSNEWGAKEVEASRDFVNLLYDEGILLKAKPDDGVAIELEDLVPEPESTK